MAQTKKVYFGSLFEFAKTGAEEILEGFRDQFADPEDVPFVSFNKLPQVCVPLFSADVEVNDNTIVSLINAQIGTYITLNNKTNDPLDSDRLVPIDGTTNHNDTNNVITRDLEPHALFEIEESSDDEQTEPISDNTLYWKPKCGDISILSSDVAAEIADLTGTFLIPDFPGQRIQLAHGNLQLALEKLERLEDVLTLITPHRLDATSRTNGNTIFVLGGPEATIKFVRPDQTHPAFNRILLGSTQISIFNQILLSELRIWEQTQRVKPENLDLVDVSLTSPIAACELFDRTSLPTLGSVKNAEPKTPSTEQSQVSGEFQRPNSPTKFLGQKDTERVEEWRGNIDLNATPLMPPVEPVTEEDQKHGRRKVVQDSDDSDDEDGDAALHAARASVTEEVIHIPVQEDLHTPRPTTGRRVAVKEDTSSDEDEETDNKPEAKVETPPRKITQQKIKSSLSTGKQRSKAVSQQRSNNMFDAIGQNLDDEDDEARSKQDSSLGGQSSEHSSSRPRHLEVKFEDYQPATQYHDAQNPSNQMSPRKTERPTAPSFDSSNYGAKQSMSKSRPSANQKQSSFSHGRNSSMSGNPVQPMPRPANRGDMPKAYPRNDELYRSRGAFHSGRRGAQSRQQNLIDITDEPDGDDPVMPPPGFDYRSGSSGLADFLMSPHTEAVYQPPIRPHNAVEVNSNSLQSVSGSTNHDDHLLEFTPQLTIPKRNINYLQGQAAARLRAEMSGSTAKSDQNNHGLPPNRIQTNDEHSTRKYHNTMNQKMARPGKGKAQGNNKKETKAEKEARIAKAKAEAYGDVTGGKETSNAQPSSSRRQAVASDMSAKKRQLLKKNQNMADMHPDALSDDAVRDAATNIMEDLKPILQATLAFKGVIKVEFQFGQALIVERSRLDDVRPYTVKDWQLLLNNKARSNAKVTFTNILTTNGRDIDRMLEMKSDGESCKIWDKDQPGITSVNFEFTCQDKSGREFVLVLHQDGSHHLQKTRSTIGQVALHTPGQIWDACVVVEGTMEFLRPSPDVLVGVEQFKESLYMPGGQKVAVYYRLPANNSFTIKAIAMKRVSTHCCLLKDHHSINLRVTETKYLAHSSNPSDKKLFRSFESSYTVMVNENRMHYDVAITDTAIENVFKGNPVIEIGESATILEPNGKIVTNAQLRKLVGLATYMLERIDWAGANNFGTLQRIRENAADQRASIAHTLPPNLINNLPIPMGTTAPLTIAPTTYQSVHSRVGGPGTSTINPEPMLRQLQGIRMGSVAELYQDRATGEYFYLGAGGSRIPVVNEQIEGLKFDGMGAIRPADSASQVGDSKRKMPLSSSWVKAGSMAEERPPGFW